VIVVVSDTSPIRALANIGLLTLLRDIYSEVVVPPAVEWELRNPPAGQEVLDLSEISFITIRVPSEESSHRDLLEGLDPGETEALSLALEIQADLLLIDEADGRARAKRLGLKTIGVLGILLEARHRRIIGSLAPMLDRLRDEYRFFISPQLRAEVLRSAGEEP
jgi:predicted nucleic acid-binding protein